LVALAISGAETTTQLALAWLFVSLRIVPTAIRPSEYELC